MASIPVTGQLSSTRDWTWQLVGGCERIASTVLLAALAPVLAVCAIAVSVLSGTTPFIAHRRVGWRGATLWMLKLRTMWGEDACPRPATRWVEYIEDEDGPDIKEADDPRVPSGFARFCRRHSIDELPQLWHVIAGEMALVGPRPVTASELRRHYAGGLDILQVKPGIAGLWQVSGRNRLSYAERRALDVEFVRRRSLRMYLGIVLRTVPEIFRGANSW